jgi:uncharacterized SAM-binding protein YcdF (DUF218 family)
MSEKDLIASTEEQTPTRKKKFLALWLLILIVPLVAIPIWSLKSFESTILSFSGIKGLKSSADCGVVLTGGSGRVREAMSLLSQKKVRKLIISGVHPTSTLNDIFPEILFYPEIDLEDVILERRSNTTESNAQQSLAVVEALHCKSVLLITSDYHLYRAFRTFGIIFPPTLSVVPYAIPTDRLTHNRRLWFDTRYWGIVFEEWYKFLFYSLFVF